MANSKKNPAEVPVHALIWWYDTMRDIREDMREKGVEELPGGMIAYKDASRLVRERIKWRRRSQDGYRYDHDRYKADVAHALTIIREKAEEHAKDEARRLGKPQNGTLAL